jgi:hypothetical protein
VQDYHPDDEDRLREAALERLGTRTPRCRFCGEQDPFTLSGRDPDVICYECLARRSGKSPTEEHHPFGRRNDPLTVRVPGNPHRTLSALQRSWPVRTLRNPEGSPLLRAAATVRGWLNVLHVIVERVGWVPAYLERLDQQLTGRLGPRWWTRLDDLPPDGTDDPR